MLSQIIDMVAQAGRSRAPIQKLADKVAGYFVPAVVAVAVLAFVVWFLFGPEPRLAYANGHEDLFFWLTIASSLGFIASLLFIPWLVIQIPDDYFSHKKRHQNRWEKYPPAMRYMLIMIKNLLGAIIVLAGIAMLVLPGQGIITILLGIFFMNFPGKYKLELWIIKRPAILKSINWIRAKANHSPLILSDKK